MMGLPGVPVAYGTFRIPDVRGALAVYNNNITQPLDQFVLI